MAIIKDGVIAADLPLPSLLAQFREDRYRVTVGSRLDAARLDLPSGSEVAEENGSTTVTVPTDNHRGLYYLLDELRELDAPVESVQRVAPDLEDVFIRLLAGAK